MVAAELVVAWAALYTAGQPICGWRVHYGRGGDVTLARLGNGDGQVGPGRLPVLVDWLGGRWLTVGRQMRVFEIDFEFDSNRNRTRKMNSLIKIRVAFFYCCFGFLPLI